MMSEETQAIIEKVREAVTPILSSMQLDLVDVELSGYGKRSLLRVFIDKPGGVTLDDCEQANRYIGHALDVADPIPTAYTLEVSSPGLDRPLRQIEDYRRNAGKRIRLKLIRPLQGAWTLVGRLQQIHPDRIELQPEGGEPVEVALADVALARLEVEW